MPECGLVLVTGGTGYVGSALVPRLAKKYPVRVLCTEDFGNPIAGTEGVEFIKGDITNTKQVKDAMVGVESVIHLAAIVTDELVDMNRGLGYRVNVGGTDILLGAALRAGVERFVYASSSSVYGKQNGQPATELTEPNPQTVYAVQKLDAERNVLGFGFADGVDNMTVTAVRSATLCGPAPRMRADTICNVFSKQAYFDGAITVFDGTQIRSNIHVDDAVGFYMYLLSAAPALVHRQVFNAAHNFMPAKAIAEEIESAFFEFSGRHVPINVLADRKDDRDYAMVAPRAKEVLGFTFLKTIKQAALDNFAFFAEGGMANPNDEIYYNSRRMLSKVLKG